MAYINTDNNAYPLSEQDIKAAHTQTSFPHPFVPMANYQWVFPVPQPAFNAVTEMAVEGAPAFVNGKYQQTWSVVPRFTEYTDDQGVAHTVAEQEAAAVAADTAARNSATLEIITARRYRAETSGITVGGLELSTERESRANLAAAYSFAVNESSFTVNWKTPSGDFVALNAEQIRAAALAVASHVQACYNREQELAAAVADGTYTADDLEQGWPVV